LGEVESCLLQDACQPSMTCIVAIDYARQEVIHRL
jgi:hypothetical protein